MSHRPFTDNHWKETLTDEQYRICRLKGTEAPFSGKYYKENRKGNYRCICCRQALFSSNAKFNAGCGWPSFWQPIAKQAVKTCEDDSLHMLRTEVMCSHCSSHLGHLFEDGPEPTGLRYCINSAALIFEEVKSF